MILAATALLTTLFPDPGRSEQIATTGSSPTVLAADVSACSLLRSTDVANYASQVRDAHAMTLTQRLLTGPDITNPVAIRAFAQATMPHLRPAIGTWHPMTSYEYAMFRAGTRVALHGLTVWQAIALCRPEAVAARSQARPLFQSCGNPPCIYPVESNYDVRGDRANQIVNSSTGTITGTQAVNVSNVVTETGARGGAVTVTSWEPFANGGKGGVVSLPAVREIVTAAAVSYGANVPQPSAVPQSGWVVLPGTPYWAYLGSGSIVTQFDGTGNDYQIVSTAANNGTQVQLHGVVPTTGQVLTYSTPIGYSKGTGPGELTWLRLGLIALRISLGLTSYTFPQDITDAFPPQTISDPSPLNDPSIIDWSYGAGDFWDVGGGGGCAIGASMTARGMEPLCDSGGDESDDW